MIEVKNISAALFDMDGTIIDSRWMWRSIDIEYLGRFGIPFPEDLQASISGMSFSETAVYFKERFSLGDSLDKIKSDWNEMAFYKYTHEVPLKEGVSDFLRDLRSKNIACAIATSNSRELVDAVVGALGVKDDFGAIVTACEAGRGKPAPDIYLLAADMLGADPKECIVFEDIANGLYAGKAAGMRTCAVWDEFSEKDWEDIKEIADISIRDYTQIRLFR